ncbi:MAG TPA: hypothetical protein VHB18_13450 [Mycobacteriales bacterium]|jgi:hypothetical protein|nr:hypothetical protein [Mycobacteriales bacterium]
MSDRFGPGGGPDGIFDNLDDPTPPVFGNELLPGVLSRGNQIRRQRRTTYGIASACAVVLVAGAAVGLAGGHSGGSRHPVVASSLTPTPHPHHSPKHRHHGGTTVTTNPHHPGSGNATSTPTSCPTATPPSTPAEQPTPTDSDSPTPTDTPLPTDSPSSTPTAEPTDTLCPSSTPTADPSDDPSVTPTPTDSHLLPIIGN